MGCGTSIPNNIDRNKGQHDSGGGPSARTIAPPPRGPVKEHVAQWIEAYNENLNNGTLDLAARPNASIASAQCPVPSSAAARREVSPQSPTRARDAQGPALLVPPPPRSHAIRNTDPPNHGIFTDFASSDTGRPSAAPTNHLQFSAPAQASASGSVPSIHIPSPVVMSVSTGVRHGRMHLPQQANVVASDRGVPAAGKGNSPTGSIPSIVEVLFPLRSHSGGGGGARAAATVVDAAREHRDHRPSHQEEPLVTLFVDDDGDEVRGAETVEQLRVRRTSGMC